MNTFLKWILAGIGLIAVLLVITAVVLPFIVDPNDYKDEISNAVHQKTGRDLMIGGEIEWTVFPWIGLTVSDVELGNRDGFGDRPMLSVGDASASVKLMPLFSQKIEIGNVALSDTSIYLRRKADGQNNWEDLRDSGTADTSKSRGDGVEAFTVSGIGISNANVTWHDADQITELTGFGMQVSNIEPGQPVDLEGAFSVNLAQSQTSGDAEFGGRLQTAADGTRHGIENLVFAFRGQKGAGDDATTLDLAINTNADIDLTGDTAQLSDFVFEFHDLSVHGDLKVTALSDDPRLEGKLQVAEFSPRALMKAMGMEIPPTASDDVLNSLAADMSFTGTSDEANMRNLTVKFDQSTFVGNLKVDNFDYPRIAFDFQVDALNLDDYLPATETESGRNLTAADFQGFTGGGDFRIGTLVVAGLTATDVSLKLSSSGEGIRLFPIKALFYGGNYHGDVNINASKKRPLMTTIQTLSSVQAQGLLQDLTGSATLEGMGDFKLNIRGDLTNPKSFRQTLTGNIGMSFMDGAIRGINIAETIRTAKSAFGLDAGPATEASGEPKTDFSKLSMTGVFDKGVMKSNDFNMLSPLLRVTGKGQVNLPDETIDFLVEPVLVSSLEGQGGKGLDKLAGIPIPIRLSGNLFEPGIKVDIAAALTGSQKAAIDKKKDELKSKALGKLFGEEDETDTAEAGESDTGADDEKEGAAKDEAAEEEAAKEKDDDSPGALLKSLLGGSRDEKKKDGKDDDGGR